MLEKSRPYDDPINDDIPDDIYDPFDDIPEGAAGIAERKPKHNPINDDIPDDIGSPTPEDERRREQWRREWLAFERAEDPAPRHPPRRDIAPPRREVTVTSYLGDRVWRRVGERDYTTRAGKPTVLAVWETPCAVCGAPFQIMTPTTATGEKTKSFTSSTCPVHRMTPSESMKLRYAKTEKRRDVFEAIKRMKLAR